MLSAAARPGSALLYLALSGRATGCYQAWPGPHLGLSEVGSMITCEAGTPTGAINRKDAFNRCVTAHTKACISLYVKGITLKMSAYAH
jgi:hypothetical protein